MAKHELGTQIFVRMVDELAKEGVRKLDFGLGDAHYKRRFGDSTWREASFRVFAPTLKGVFLRSSTGVSSLFDGATKKLLSKIALSDRVKTEWRKRLPKRD
jgi:CelD/BcsL family acetyltransferase involved in cellulose biosynthesis